MACGGLESLALVALENFQRLHFLECGDFSQHSDNFYLPFVLILITASFRPGDLAMRVISPGVPVDWTMI